MDPNSVDLVIYHGGCSDGFGAAFAAWKLLGSRAKYVPGKFGTPPPDVTGKVVVIVDFSYDNATTKQMIDQAEDLLVLDHHKSALIELHDINQTHFDMSKSGAILSWEFFHPGKEPPKFLRYIQDRDLWTWELPYSREFSASFDMIPFQFTEFDAFCDDSVFDDAVKRGSYILAHKRTFINKVVDRAAKRMILGKTALVVNSSHWMSEIGNVLKMSADVGVVWYFDHKDGSYHVSLRSDGENVDVSEVAKHFGGGGHPGASGLRWPATKSIEEIFDEPGKEPEDTEEDLGGSGEAEGPITHTSGSS